MRTAHAAPVPRFPLFLGPKTQGGTYRVVCGEDEANKSKGVVQRWESDACFLVRVLLHWLCC